MNTYNILKFHFSYNMLLFQKKSTLFTEVDYKYLLSLHGST